ncbi:MAG: tRNA pseudouridine(38-40) synthase TruA [Haloarculaceae archaeon]
MRRAFRVAYDGTGYRGFQRQPHGETVSNAILDALDALGVANGVPPGYAAAGRTDAGVSALAQTVAFDCPDWLTPAALNGELPADVRAWASADVPASFHATHDADARTYVYYHHAPDADPASARAALERLAGGHDFHNLTPDDSGTERELETDLTVEGDYHVLTFRAGGFPRQFVRRAVTLVAEAAADGSTTRVERALSATELTGPAGIAPAPAEPLVLADVDYPGVAFERDDAAAAGAREIFEEKRTRRRTGARVAGHVASGL